MSFINSLADKLYKQSTSGWLGQKMNDIVGDDYQKHLLNMSIGGMTPLNAAAGYGMDYQQAEDEGESGWGRVGQNAGRSAAILASIFGGSALAGGGAGGGSAGGGAGGATQAGAGGGAAGGGANWYKMLAQGLGGMQQGQGGGGGGQGAYRQPVDFSQPAFAPAQGAPAQQQPYSPLAPNGMNSGLMALGSGYYGY